MKSRWILFVFPRAFSKFKETLRLIPATIQSETALDENSAREIFPSIQPIYRYIKVGSVVVFSSSISSIYFIDDLLDIIS